MAKLVRATFKKELQMNILIVDDNPAALCNLENVLSGVVPESLPQKADSAEDAIRICRKTPIEIAFIDVEMPDMDGLTLAKELTKLRPFINIIMVTGHPQYALEAHHIFVSGYILKPAMEDEVLETLKHLRHPIVPGKGFYVRCFGKFEVFYDGMPLKFKRSKAKELFAYLIDNNGAEVNSKELCAALFGNEADGGEKQQNYLRHIWRELKETLASVGCDDILVHSHNAYSVDIHKANCDYYRENPTQAWFTGEYMNQYEWAEFRRGQLYMEHISALDERE